MPKFVKKNGAHRRGERTCEVSGGEPPRAQARPERSVRRWLIVRKEALRAPCACRKLGQLHPIGQLRDDCA